MRGINSQTYQCPRLDGEHGYLLALSGPHSELTYQALPGLGLKTLLVEKQDQ
jgi:hypothetical protein